MRYPKMAFLLLLSVIFTSCGARKKVSNHSVEVVNYSSKTPDEIKVVKASGEDAKTFKVIENALDYVGTKYRYGGTTKKGMDCSGLIYTAFLQEDIALPRTSRDMSLLGNRLNLDEVVPGDFLFFETSKKKKVINHVGLVVELDAENIYFIHSTSSRGVIVSALAENYWREHFVMARRVQ